MSLIADVASVLGRLSPNVVSVIYQLVETILKAPEDEREEIATRALKATASRQGTLAAVDAALKAGK